MLAFIACLIATQVPIDQPPRLRTLLPNGSCVIVERLPEAKSLSIQMFASSRGTAETPITNGLRHLLEHLIAKGTKGDIDKRLETAGGFLTAETSRDAMIFRISLPPGQLGLGLRFLEELTQMPQVTQEDIRKEALILEQEAALQDTATKFSVAAWTQAYGDRGLDPLGNLDVIRNATPTMLDAIHRIQFTGSNVVIAVAGDVDLDSASKSCAAFLSKLPKSEATGEERKPGAGGQTSVDISGEAFSLPVPGFRLPETAARLAAALALASEADHCFVLFTPSANPGMVTFGRTDDKAGLTRVVTKARPEELFARGQFLAKLWIARMLNTPEHIANFRGLLLDNKTDLKPEILLENVNAMTYKQFAAAVIAFRSSEAVVVTGR